MVLSSPWSTLSNFCCLCYDTAPPYYEGITAQGTIADAAKSDEYRWHSPHPQTPEQATGQELCISEVPDSKAFLCNLTYPLTPSTTKCLILQNDTW